MQKRNKTLIHIILTGMVLLNLLLAFFVLVPVDLALGAAQDKPQVSQSQSTPAQVPILQRFRMANQAARKFWTDLLPFWDRME